MTTQNKNIPALRFPEFENDWKKEKIEHYLKLYVERVKADTDIPILTSSRNGLFMQKDYFDNRELDNEGEYGVVPRNYFTYRHMSDDSTFKFNINTICDKGAVSKEYPVFTTNEMDSYFLQLKLNYGDEFKQFAHIQKAGGTRTRLYFSKLTQLNLSIPTLPEQKKIAAFLTAVDEKIQQLTKKKDLLEQYKKGVMQKIFNQEIRFKDDNGNDFADWEEKKLGEVGEIIAGGTPDTLIPEFWGGNIQWLTPTEIKSKYIYKSIRTITERGLQKSSAKLLPKGTLLLSTRATVGDIGIAMREFCTNQGFQSIVVNENNVNEFIYYWIVKNKNEFLKKANGSTFLEINKTEISKLKILLPSKLEQKKIANFFSAIDDKVNLVNQQLEKTKEYKKGLLQQMFV